MKTEEMFRLFMEQIKELKHDINNVHQELKHDINNVHQELKQDINNVNQDIKDMKNDISAMKGQLDRIEEAQQQEVFGMLKVVDKKITNVSYDIDYLREQSSRHDMDIERIKKQIRS
ncbi:DUF2746 domain-containing protein [Alkalihalobacterium alkalinitrilicum]|uniref:DUF2746 domain-containing protein n=1 Tax=Alkalihalobacterium alkalinitrilicum TaxID=427920 RepID=UPI0009955D55|nr:DUF2746 domain-containing protein [Alkalihalobacterium alkalinitrilicum]